MTQGENSLYKICFVFFSKLNFMSYEVKGMLVFYEKGKVKIEARGRVVG
jgi:hypothetical protein